MRILIFIFFFAFLASCIDQLSNVKNLPTNRVFISTSYKQINITNGKSIDSTEEHSAPFLIHFTDSNYTAYFYFANIPKSGRWKWTDESNKIVYLNSPGDYWRFVSANDSLIVTEEWNADSSGKAETGIKTIRYFRPIGLPEMNKKQIDDFPQLISLATWRIDFPDNTYQFLDLDTLITISEKPSLFFTGNGTENFIQNDIGNYRALNYKLYRFYNYYILKTELYDNDKSLLTIESGLYLFYGNKTEGLQSLYWPSADANPVKCEFNILKRSLSKSEQEQYMNAVAGRYRNNATEIWVSPHGYYSVDDNELSNYQFSMDGNFMILQDSILLKVDTVGRILTEKSGKLYKWNSSYLKK